MHANSHTAAACSWRPGSTPESVVARRTKATTSGDHLYEQQRACCAICGIEDEWNGVTLALIIDHINGDATNSRRENLRLICPNCDSQLPTYKARNRGSGRYTGDSGTRTASPIDVRVAKVPK